MDFALVLLTAALVVTTIAYAYFTAKMVTEMRESRELSIRPRIALEVQMLSPTIGMVALRSLGPGTAVDVAVLLSFTPPGETRAWRSPVFVPGQQAIFETPPPVEGDLGHNMEALKKHGVTVVAKGSMSDLNGREYRIDETLSAADWWSVVSESQQLFLTDVRAETNRELEKLRRAVEKIGKRLASS